MATTYTDNNPSAGDGSRTEFRYTFPVIQTEDVKVSLNGVTQATTKYTVDNVSNPTHIDFNNTSIDSSVQENSGAPKSGVRVRVYRETTVGKTDGNEDPKAVFAAGSSIRAIDLNANQEQSLMSIHELQTRPIETEDIQDDAVTSAKIDDGTIVEGNLANSAVTQNKLADNSVGTTELINGSVNSDKILDGTIVNADVNASAAIAGTKVDPHFGSQNITTTGGLGVGGGAAITGDLDVDGLTTLDGATIDNIRIGITNDNEIDTLSGNLTIDSTGGTTTIDDNLTVTGNVTLSGTIGVSGTTTASNITGGAVVTSGTSTSDTKVYSAKRAGEIFYGKGTVEEIQSGETWTAADDKVATTAAIDARIVDLVDDVGGFVPLANETSFPNTNPDVNNGAGTLVSIKALSQNYTSSSTGVITIPNGTTVQNSTVTITGAGNSVTYQAGFGLIVETTVNTNQYAFHRLVPKATEVTTVATNATQVQTVHNNISQVQTVHNNISDIQTVAADASDIGAVAGKATEIGRLGTADAVADMAILGTTDVVSDLNTLGTADVVADMNMLATSDVVADMALLATTDVISDMNDLATSANITAMSNCSGSIANINTTASNITNVNNFADRYQIAANNPSTDGGGNALAAGDLYFNTSANELKVYNGSAWQGGVTATGTFAATTGNTFTGDNRYNDGVKALFGTGSDLEIFHDGTYNKIESGGTTLHIRSNLIELGDNSGNKYIKCIDGAATELYYDAAKKFETTSAGAQITGNLAFGDNGIASFGASGDLQIFHNGSNSLIHDTGTGGVIIAASKTNIMNSAAGENMAVFNDNGSVELYHDSIKKFETRGGGVTVYNTNASNVSAEFHDASGNAGYIWGTGTNFGLLDKSGDWGVRLYNNSQVELYHNGVPTFQTDPNGIKLLGPEGGDAEVNLFADEGDDNSDKWRIQALAAGGFNIQNFTGTWENSLTAVNNGAIELYHDNIKTFETISGGAKLQGGEGLAAHLYMFADEGDDNADKWVFRADASSSQLKLRNYAGGSWEESIIANGNGSVELYDNNTKRFETGNLGVRFFGNIYADDNEKIILGSGQDLQIYHDGSHTRVHHSGTGQFIIYGNDNDQVKLMKGASEEGIILNNNGNVELYHNNSKKFETASDGISVSGNITATGGLVVSGEVDLMGTQGHKYIDADIGTNSFQIRGCNGTNVNHVTMLKAYRAGAVELNYSGGKKFETLTDGVNITGTLKVNGSAFTGGIANVVEDTSPDLGGDLSTNGHALHVLDNNRIYVGTGYDMEIYHDGSTNYIRGGSKNIDIRAVDGEQSIVANAHGSVQIYYDGSEKFATISNGVEVQGRLQYNSNNYIECNTSANTMEFIIGGGQIGEFNSSTFTFLDNKEARFGNGNDLRIYHDGTNNYINSANGNLYLQQSNQNKAIVEGGAFSPGNENIDLGKSNLRWQNVHAKRYHGDGILQVRVAYETVGTHSIYDSYGVSSIGDNGTGYSDVNFTTSYADNTYAISANGQQDSGGGARFCTFRNPDSDGSHCEIEFRSHSNSSLDAVRICAMFSGDQP